MQSKKSSLKSSLFWPAWILFIICVLVTLALAGANELTKGTIAKQEKIDADNARREVFTAAAAFEDITMKIKADESLKISSVYTALDSQNQVIGLVIISASRGYAGDVFVMSGITPDRSICGIKVMSDDETPGLGKKIEAPSFAKQFIDQTAGLLFSVKVSDSSVNYVDAVTGATISSRAMTNAANNALTFAEKVFSELKLGGNS